MKLGKEALNLYLQNVCFIAEKLENTKNNDQKHKKR